MNIWPLLPLLTCLFTTILTFFFFRFRNIQRFLSVINAFSLTVIGILLLMRNLSDGILVTQLGNWPAPYGISFVIDKFSALMILLTGITSFCIGFYSLADIRKTAIKAGFYPAFNILLLGICGAFSTGDLFNLYVWFEVLLIASFVLVSLTHKKETLGGIVKYVILNLLSTSILLIGIAFLYNLTGTLNMADLAVRTAQSTAYGTAISLLLLVMFSFAIKAALFPVYSWLPAAYPETSVSASSLFAALLTKVGIYSIIRIYALFFIHAILLAKIILIIIGSLTLLSGILSATNQNHIRRLLSFCLISHSGYIILGLALFTQLSLTGVIFFIIQHMLTITQLFLASGIMRKYTGSSLLSKMGGLYQNYPLFSLLFFIAALSLAGFPPLAGFWAKLVLIIASVQLNYYYLAAIMILGGIITLIVMINVWQQAFYKNLPEEQTRDLAAFSISSKIFFLTPFVLLTCSLLVISFFPNKIFQLSESTANQLLNSQQYIAAVLENPEYTGKS